MDWLAVVAVAAAIVSAFVVAVGFGDVVVRAVDAFARAAVALLIR